MRRVDRCVLAHNRRTLGRVARDLPLEVTSGRRCAAVDLAGYVGLGVRNPRVVAHDRRTGGWITGGFPVISAAWRRRRTVDLTGDRAARTARPARTARVTRSTAPAHSRGAGASSIIHHGAAAANPSQCQRRYSTSDPRRLPHVCGIAPFPSPWLRPRMDSPRKDTGLLPWDESVIVKKCRDGGPHDQSSKPHPAGSTRGRRTPEL